MYFYITPVVSVPGTNMFMCMVYVLVGDKMVCNILLMEKPNRKEQPKPVIKPLADELMEYPKCQLSYSITHPYSITGVTTAFPFRGLPCPNLKDNIRSGQGNSEHNEDGNQPPARYTRYADYNQRLQTFNTGWPHVSPKPRTLSEAGFFYTGKGDVVRCFHCGLGVHKLKPDADPLEFHARFSPNCPFLCRLIGVDSLQNILCSSVYIKLYKHQQRKRRVNRRRYRHPENADLQNRLATFTNWPSAIHTPMELAEAGFYYTGSEDLVRCFACDSGLNDWDEGDNPWTEHCRWFPNCRYAIEVKGQEHIALVQAAVNTLIGEDTTGEDIQTVLEGLILSDPITQTMLNEHKTQCLQLGYDEVDFESTVQDLRNRGNAKPTLDDILDLIDIIQVNRQQPTSIPTNETPEENNRRLKSYVYCMQCEKNDINALFLPCGHHKLCMTCAQPLECCPVCGRNIREKIKTYMG